MLQVVYEKDCFVLLTLKNKFLLTIFPHKLYESFTFMLLSLLIIHLWKACSICTMALYLWLNLVLMYCLKMKRLSVHWKYVQVVYEKGRKQMVHLMGWIVFILTRTFWKDKWGYVTFFISVPTLCLRLVAPTAMRQRPMAHYWQLDPSSLLCLATVSAERVPWHARWIQEQTQNIISDRVIQKKLLSK